MRRQIIAGNWKMNKTKQEAVSFMKELLNQELPKDIDIVVCPPYFGLEAMAELAKDKGVTVLAQNVHQADSGAYTGEVSVDMLRAVGVEGSLIGHSERRKYFGESDEVVASKVAQAKAKDFSAIICVGEDLDQRNSGKHETVVTDQVKAALKPLVKEDLKLFTIAYEPVWAIGTGKTATAQDAQAMCQAIRLTVAQLFDKEAAAQMRILYGGSVKPSNVDELMAQEDIDGALVGGASLEVESFLQLVNYKR